MPYDKPAPEMKGYMEEFQKFTDGLERGSSEFERAHRDWWLQMVFPQLNIAKWDEADKQLLDELRRRHVCGVCGRADDSGCALGC